MGTVTIRTGHWFDDLVSCNDGNGLFYHQRGLKRDKIMQKKTQEVNLGIKNKSSSGQKDVSSQFSLAFT